MKQAGQEREEEDVSELDLVAVVAGAFCAWLIDTQHADDGGHFSLPCISNLL